MFNFFLSKNGVSPVVATALLLVVAVISVVGFQGWFTAFSSSVLVDVESQTSSAGSARVEGVINDNLYLNSVGSTELDMLVVKDELGNEVCSFDNSIANVSNVSLVGYWRFDDFNFTIKDYSGVGNDGLLYGSSRLLLNFDSNNADDLTSYNNDGTIDGATWTNSECVSGGCFNFNGIDQRILIGNSSTINLTHSTSWTISAWGKLVTSNTNSSEVLVGAYNGSGSNAWWIGSSYGKSKRAVFSVHDGSDETVVLSPQLMNDSQWHHIVGVRDLNKDIIQLYVDGILVNETEDLTGVMRNPYPITIGDFGDYPADFFHYDGLIDEVGIYSKALSAGEIKKLFDLKKSNFVEFTNDGVDFDGRSYIDINSLRNDINIGEFSVFAKAKTSSFPNADTWHHTIFSNINSSVERIYLFCEYSISGDKSYWSTFGKDNNIVTADSDGFSKCTPGKEFSIVATFDSGNNAQKLYVNSILENQSNYSAVDVGLLNIGAYATLGSGTNKFEGEISEVRVYNRILNDSEIKFLSSPDLSLNKNLNKLDLSSCNLEKGKKYNILTGSNDGLSEVSVIVK